MCVSRLCVCQVRVNSVCMSSVGQVSTECKCLVCVCVSQVCAWVGQVCASGCQVCVKCIKCFKRVRRV